jgi:uncharacterized protein YbjT (DUF2867 family)
VHVAVAGGTGMVGTLVVAAAWRAGHTTTVLSRSHGVDLISGSGLADRLAGVDCVVDVANSPGISRTASVSFFQAATRNLLRAERDTGVGHHVALSIVGVDRVPSGYYAGKLAQEELIADGPVPWTVLRATQFHEFPSQLLRQLRGPGFLPVPKMRSATVAAAEVAHRLVEIVESGIAAGFAPELAGPEVHEMPDLVRQLVRARGSRRPVLGVRIPGRAGAAMASGGLLPRTAAPRGRQTFAQWLSEYEPT